ncbi:MAG: 4Fe-4S dicluster domain-containing protein [Bacteroidetes bacterium]|nr:4Fe-4S dicluster domain-containing protein [Bacteroidota bacterium]
METEKDKSKTRRDFFKASALVATGLALNAVVMKPGRAAAEIERATAAKIPDPDVQYGFAIDLDKCIGCGNCAKACKIENDVPQEPFYFRTWVEQYVVKCDETMKIESPNGGIDGLKQSVSKEGIEKSFFVPKMCNHCAKSPCEQVCPVGATFRSPDGVVLIDKEYCIGCGYCVQSCPYGCRYISPITHTVDKCTMCYHRLKKGLQPACVEACPTGARMQGNLRDKDGPLVKFIKEHNCRVLKPHLNTAPKLFYNSLSEKVI